MWSDVGVISVLILCHFYWIVYLFQTINSCFLITTHRRQAGEDSDPEEVIAEWKSKTRNKFGDDSKMDETDKSVTKEWWAAYVTEDDKLKLELSNKLHLLFEILRMCEEIGDKVYVPCFVCL